MCTPSRRGRDGNTSNNIMVDEARTSVQTMYCKADDLDVEVAVLEEEYEERQHPEEHQVCALCLSTYIVGDGEDGTMERIGPHMETLLPEEAMLW